MTTTMTLADLAATSLSAVRILEQHGLDYCCDGKQPLEQACLAKNLTPQAVMREIEEAKVENQPHAAVVTAPSLSRLGVIATTVAAGLLLVLAW